MSSEEKADPAGGNALGLPSDVKKAGILRKLKTMKKKHFGLRTESENSPARLEYYDSEKKFHAGAIPKRKHVWQVTIGDKSLARSRNMKGLYRVCLTLTSLSLIKVEQSDNPETLEFPLMSIQRCGHSNKYFFIELDQSSIIGTGELWLETEHEIIAQNMHETTLKVMKSCKEHEDLGPLPKPRNSSNIENFRPFVTRHPTVNTQIISYGGMRDRCDSMPSRPWTVSEGQEIANSRYSCSSSTDGAVHTEPPFKEEPPDDYLAMSVGERPPCTKSSREANGYLYMAPVYSTSAPTGPSRFLNLSPSEVLCYGLFPTSEISEYVEMAPQPSADEYIPMSSLGALSEKNVGMNFQPSPIPESTDCYVDMALGKETSSASEDYVEMTSVLSSLPKPFPDFYNYDAMEIKEKQKVPEPSVLLSPEISKQEVFPLDQMDDSSDDFIGPVGVYSVGNLPKVSEKDVVSKDRASVIRITLCGIVIIILIISVLCYG